jgi:molybdopterin molybdotransferase
VFGLLGNTIFFGLPGNPVSAAVVFDQFIEPAIRVLAGSAYPFRSLMRATSLDGFKQTKNRLHFARGVVSHADRLLVKSAGKQGSHMLSSLARSNCYVWVPADQEIREGDEVLIQLHGAPQVTFDKFREAFALSGL